MADSVMLTNKTLINIYANAGLCTVDICPIDSSNYDYRVSLPMNALLLALFGMALVSHVIQGTVYKTWGFLIAMFFGCVGEIIGYGGRILSHNSPWDGNGFLIQICCLTIAPAFFAAGIYLCLSRIVIIFGEDISRIRPKSYTYIFVGCDFISLCLQGAGGGIASTTSQDGEEPVVGTNIMLAGLAFQVFTLSLFMILCAEYAYRVWRSSSALNTTHAKLRASKKFRGFLIALALSTVFIMVRSVYRVIELAQGWNGDLIGNQGLFFVLEGIMVILAVLVLNVFHPGWCFQEGYRVKGGKSSEEGSMMN